MRTRKSRCDNCNAPLAAGTVSCAYCGPLSSERSASAAGSASARRYSGGFLVKAGLGLVSLLCCAPLGIFGTLYETVYSIHLEAPKYSAHSLELEQRPTEDISPMRVFQDMRDTGEESLARRKQQWRERYEGHWVSWTGRVKHIQVYERFASELLLQAGEDPGVEVQVHFDPLYNPQLTRLREGERVSVSGRLWGYYFMDDSPRLSEGRLLTPDVSRQARERPL